MAAKDTRSEPESEVARLPRAALNDIDSATDVVVPHKDA